MQAAGHPIAVAYGGGVDSTAFILGLHALGVRPDLILMADTGDEKQETYDFVHGPMTAWLKSVGFPPVTWVRYVPKNFKHWPAYHTLSENCLTNSTLPSLAFGFKSCSLKWKVGPQNKYTESWEPAKAAWAAGKKVIKLIGYDAGPKDIRRRNHAGDRNDHQYEYRYPLIEWGWDREACKAYIAFRGLPVPPKSACYMCPATHPEELHDFPVELLQRIVIIESRSFDRLMGNWSEETMLAFNKARWEKWDKANVLRPPFDVWLDHSFNKPNKRKLLWTVCPATDEDLAAHERGELKMTWPKAMTTKGGVTGLWRATTRTRSGRITDYIRNKGLLPEEEVDRLIRETPREPLSAADITSWEEFIAGLMEQTTPGCAGCTC